jgi:16S rRNA C967 or C1407 C5-methylase (RsmB/RsmF family)
MEKNTAYTIKTARSIQDDVQGNVFDELRLWIVAYLSNNTDPEEWERIVDWAAKLAVKYDH